MRMSQVEVNAWNSIQSGLTAVFIAFYPFITCLLYQIRHEMASNPKQFTIRKIALVTLLTSQIIIFTFLRDQYVWNEQINEQDELPNALLCGLSRYIFIKNKFIKSSDSIHLLIDFYITELSKLLYIISL